MPASVKKRDSKFGGPMRSIIILVFIAFSLAFNTFLMVNTTDAWETSDLIGLPPDQVEQFLRRQQQYDKMTLELMKERLRLERERNQNPFMDCILVGNVEGRNIEEAKNLARSLGADRISWINVTSKSVSAQAYKCSTE